MFNAWIFPNIVNIKVAEFVKYQPHVGTNHLFSAKKAKIVRKKVISRNWGCLNISNLVNTKFTEIMKFQPHGGSNHLFSVKTIKIEKEKEWLSYQTVLASLAC